MNTIPPSTPVIAFLGTGRRRRAAAGGHAEDDLAAIYATT